MIWVNDIPTLEPGDLCPCNVFGPLVAHFYAIHNEPAETPTERFPDYGYQGDVKPL